MSVMVSSSPTSAHGNNVLGLLLQNDEVTEAWTPKALESMLAENDTQIRQMIENQIYGHLDLLSCALKRALLVCVLVNSTEFQLLVLRQERRLKEGSHLHFLSDLSHLYTAYSEGEFDENALQNRAIELYQKHVTKAPGSSSGAGAGSGAGGCQLTMTLCDS